MRLFKFIFLTFLAVLSSLGLSAQSDIIVWYEVVNSGGMDNVRLYLQNTRAGDIELGTANLSIAYNTTSSTYSSIVYSLFDTQWGPGPNVDFRDNFTAGFPKTYGGVSYDTRMWYIAAAAFGTPITLTAGAAPLLVLEVQYTASGGASYHPETQAEFGGNSLNEASTVANIPFVVQNYATFPVEWVDFTATPIREKTVQLDWVTASEENNAGFEIERSIDALHFELIGNVEGAGNSSTAKAYTYLDEKANSPVLFYRLRQVDFNGNFTYSEVREVHMNQYFGLSVNVFPNPVDNNLNVHLDTDRTFNFEFQMQDLAGRTLKQLNQVELGPQDLKVSVEGLAQGVYSIQLIDSDNGKTYSKLFVKE